jgi:predicted flavoprotein YhiN
MFRMNVTRLASNDGMTVKEYKAGQVYAKSELSKEIFDAFILRGESETEKNLLPNVEDLHTTKRKGGFNR